MTNEQKRIKADIDALMAAQNARIELDYQKRRNSKALNFLACVLVVSIALVSLVAFAKYQNEQAAKDKETELNCKQLTE